MNEFIITYQINLTKYNDVKNKQYVNFSKSQLVELLLWGNITILNKSSNTFFHFDAELIKFFIEFDLELKDLLISNQSKKEIYSLYDTYFIELNKSNENYIKIIFDKNKKQPMIVNSKTLLLAISRIKLRLFDDLNILYPNFNNLKELNYLATRLTEGG